MKRSLSYVPALDSEPPPPRLFFVLHVLLFATLLIQIVLTVHNMVNDRQAWTDALRESAAANRDYARALDAHSARLAEVSQQLRCVHDDDDEK